MSNSIKPNNSKCDCKKSLAYFEIERCTNDLFNRNFYTNGVRLEANTLCRKSGTKYNISATRDAKSGTICGDIKARFVSNDNTVSVLNTISSHQGFEVNVEANNKIANGFKLNAIASAKDKYDILTFRGLKLISEYRQKNMVQRTVIDNKNGLCVSADVAATYGNFIGGFESSVKDKSLSNYGVSLAHMNGNYIACVSVVDRMKKIKASFHRRLSEKFEFAIRASMGVDSLFCKKGSCLNEKGSPKKCIFSKMDIEAVAKYSPDKDLNFKSKIDKFGRLGLSITQSIRPGLAATFGCAVDLLNLNTDSHNVGLTLQYDI